MRINYKGLLISKCNREIMRYATISADIVDSTKMTSEDTIRINKCLNNFLEPMMKVSTGSWGRVVKGDAFECVLKEPRDLLRVALMLKCHLKAFVPEKANPEFSKYGIRIAMAVGELRTCDQHLGIIDGDAIYRTGRTIEEKRPNVRGTMIYCSDGADDVKAIVALCDTVINKSTGKQCEVLFCKLNGMSEDAMANAMKKSRPTVNTHSQKAGWPAIEKAVKYFETLF